MNRFKKLVLTGVLTLSPIIGTGVVSAAPATVSSNDTVWSVLQKYGIDVNAIMKSNPQLSKMNIVWSGTVYKYPTCYTNTGTTVKAPTTSTQQGTTVKAPTTSTQQGTTVKAPTTSTQQGTTVKAPTTSTQQGTTVKAPTTSTQSGSSVKAPATQPTTTATSQSTFASQVVDLVNQERAKAGLKPLANDSALSAMALDKAKDMYNSHYFSHTSPTYGSPFDMMKSYGIKYTYAGENIAQGQQTPQDVMNAWMNSAGHRQNILSPNYTKIGTAYYNGEWVQEFIAN